MMRGFWRSLATALTVLCSAASLSDLVDPQVWAAGSLTTLLIALLIVTLVRRWQTGALLPTLLGLVGSVCTVTAWFASSVAVAGVIPTREALTHLYHLVLIGLEQVWAESPPIQHAPGVGLLITAGLLLAFLVADLLAVAARSPVVALIPALAIWAGPVILGEQVSMVLVAATGIAAATMIAAHSNGSTTRSDHARLRRGVSFLGATACTVVGALVLAPSLLSLPTPVQWQPPSGPGDGNATALDLGLDLHSDLRRSQSEVVMSYSGIEPAELGPLHAYTLTAFNGTSWDHTASENWQTAGDGYLWPDSFDAGSADTVAITIADLQQDRLPIPGQPRQVETDQPISYAAPVDEVRLRDSVSGTFSYELTIRTRNLTPARLAHLDPRTASADPDLLQVPDTGYTERITHLTQDVVSEADAQSAYDQLIAIQNYLRDPGVFSYTESVTSGDTDSAVWDFLQDRRGYCVQFATTMVIMARTLGIPSRLAVGYLPGSTAGEGTAQITSDQAHAWPQVLFPGVGWVRFEPTPGVQSGQTPSWARGPAASASGATATPSSEPASPASPSASAEAEQADSSAPTDSSTAHETSSGGFWWIAAVLLLLLTVPWWWHRQRQTRSLESTWQHAEGLLRRSGGDLSPGTTPRQAGNSAAKIFASQQAVAAFAELARAVELDRYARDGSEHPTAEQLRGWFTAIRSDSAVPLLHRWGIR